MSKITLLILLLFLSSCSTINDLPKMPLYIGLGYNLADGNPMNDEVDPGFGKIIFKVAYKKGEKTADSKYALPDDVVGKLTNNCTFKSNFNTHRGSLSYQNALKHLVNPLQTTSTLLSQGIFSASSSFHILQASTITQKHQITHTSAQCHSYTLSLDILKHFNVQDSFTNAVNTSFHNKNWDNFIKEYGTHFVNQIIMGARTIQEIEYGYQEGAKMRMLGVQIENAGKGRFAELVGDKSQQWEEYQEDILYSRMFSQNSSKEIYVGAKPPKDGNIFTWASTTKEHPMPIRYSLLEMTQLFDKISIVSIKTNLAAVKKSYLSSVETYCQRVNCKKGIKDLPEPGRAKTQIIKTQAVGVDQGNPFEYMLPTPNIRVEKVIARYNDRLSSVQFVLTDGVKRTFSPSFGGIDGVYVEWTVPEGFSFDQIQYKTDEKEFYGFRMLSKKGQTSPWFGTANGGESALVDLPESYQVIGLYGRASELVYRLGFVLGKTVYPDNLEQERTEAIVVEI